MGALCGVPPMDAFCTRPLVRNHQGVAYDYFTCTGRRFKRNDCQRTAALIHRIEQSIETRYQHVSVTEDEAGQ